MAQRSLRGAQGTRRLAGGLPGLSGSSLSCGPGSYAVGLYSPFAKLAGSILLFMGKLGPAGIALQLIKVGPHTHQILLKF
jgi:hypothetical protein